MIKRTKLPPVEAIDTAIAWLEANEGDNGEAERCQLVADWLAYRNQEAYLRREARVNGVPVARLRKLLEQYNDQS